MDGRSPLEICRDGGETAAERSRADLKIIVPWRLARHELCRSHRRSGMNARAQVLAQRDIDDIHRACGSPQLTAQVVAVKEPTDDSLMP